MDEAREQLDFLKEVQTGGRNPRVSYLTSLVLSRSAQYTPALQALNETLTLHITQFKSSIGFEFYNRLDADFMLQIAKEYIRSHEMQA